MSDLSNNLNMLETVVRIFRELSFKNDDTKITQKTLELSSAYIQLFVKEAIVRANEERIAEGDSLHKVDGIDNIYDGSRSNKTEEDVEQTEHFDPDDISEQDTQTRMAYDSDLPLDNDTLDSRHLAKVAGILILDF
ncbi:uncharacterized protein PRCAT00001119001 [Priceomyces carsonii]|uniref:uncharacterized protein n=1 Tax=Priceomyces carsonii TaxID=28549 RepID=UPI002ED8C1B4|nr:unnamed protein product [Priceomyces carsonii]